MKRTQILAIAGVLGAVALFLTNAKGAYDAGRGLFCEIFGCTPPDEVCLPPQVFTHSNVTARDGTGSTSGTVRDIRLSVSCALAPKPTYSFVLEWNWTGSGGTWRGDQTVVVDLKSATGATLARIERAIDRSGCFYGAGNPQSFNGKLDFPSASIDRIEVTTTAVRNVQTPC
jgi:hypothetical protein